MSVFVFHWHDEAVEKHTCAQVICFHQSLMAFCKKNPKKKHINKRDETPSVDSDLASTLPMIHFNSGGSYIRENRVLWRLKKCLGFYESFHNRLTDDLQRRWQNKPTLRVLDFVEINCSSAALWATLLQTHDVSFGCHSLAVSSPLSLHPTPRNEHVSHKLLNSFHSVLLLFHCCFFGLYRWLKKKKNLSTGNQWPIIHMKESPLISDQQVFSKNIVSGFVTSDFFAVLSAETAQLAASTLT